MTGVIGEQIHRCAKSPRKQWLFITGARCARQPSPSCHDLRETKRRKSRHLVLSRNEERARGYDQKSKAKGNPSLRVGPSALRQDDRPKEDGVGRNALAALSF
jgi:hypothetical protein